MGDLYIGLMSGTSMDAVDAALVEIGESKIQTLTSSTTPLPTTLQRQLNQLCQPGDNELNRMGVADHQLGELFAQCVTDLLEQAQVPRAHITAIGSHGQTIRHQPGGEAPFTVQIGDPNIIAARTGITTVADFRRRDMALGGEGAPLTPAFHQSMFQTDTENRVVLNIGGIANITLLPTSATQPITGFDTGPGNTLLDGWYQRHLSGPYDASGDWAASGQIDEDLLTKLMNTPYLADPPPKSTGRELFNLPWLDAALDQLPDGKKTEDIQATLSQFTADTIAQAIQHSPMQCQRILICGGGVHNSDLIRRIEHNLPNIPLEPSDNYGLAADCVEATAFAWLAYKAIQRETIDLTQVTGASAPVRLGGIYPA